MRVLAAYVLIVVVCGLAGYGTTRYALPAMYPGPSYEPLPEDTKSAAEAQRDVERILRRLREQMERERRAMACPDCRWY